MNISMKLETGLIPDIDALVEIGDYEPSRPPSLRG